MKSKLYLFAFAAMLFTACSAGKMLTTEYITQHGTRTYEASNDQIWKAVEGVLSMQGYEIAFADQEKGIINTKQKILGAVGSANPYSYQVVSTGIYRQYLIRITHEGSHCTVVLKPRVFQGNADISDQAVWRLDGPEGEQALFEKFFKELEGLL
ncbi:MAG TPA: hypothetical protein DCR43_03565 [Bacteroidales bacterium]|nr:MAG: hypothetical protein A2X11_00315 [Bacteroidetes bacterium GWE2_42_24]OFY27755.1 MAG: hypothetical protein A2X09_02585 [Bacteroidetes bacterium GWF2_43_11]HAQ64921.1 hypothetical protein [Bacteroidales bacterium]HBZ66113.1 hypothetical protein [Bacteroidales bacterium]